MRALITGGAGFIGSHVADCLVQHGLDVVVFDRLEAQVHGQKAKRPSYLNPKAKWVRGELLDERTLWPVVKEADILVHFAAMVGVGQSQYQIRRYVESNTLATAALLDMLVRRKHRLRKIIVAASMSSYGEGLYHCRKHGKVRPPLRSAHLLKPRRWNPPCPLCSGDLRPIPIPESAEQICNSVYAITKKDQEDLVMNFGRTFGVPTTALRFFNVFGTRQALSNPYTGVTAIFMSRLLNHQPPVIFEDGLQTRDFVSAADVSQAVFLCIKKSSANGETFNVGSGKAVSILEVAQTLARLLGRDIEPRITNQFRAGDVRHCFANISRIQDKLGFRPRVSLEEGLKQIIEWSDGQKVEDHFEDAMKELKKHQLV